MNFAELRICQKSTIENIVYTGIRKIHKLCKITKGIAKCNIGVISYKNGDAGIHWWLSSRSCTVTLAKYWHCRRSSMLSSDLTLFTALVESTSTRRTFSQFWSRAMEFAPSARWTFFGDTPQSQFSRARRAVLRSMRV